MLFYLLIALIVNVSTFIVDFLPNADPGVTSQINSNLSAFRTYLASANFIFPVDTALAFLTSILVIEGVILIWKTVRWIASMLTLGIVK